MSKNYPQRFQQEVSRCVMLHCYDYTGVAYLGVFGTNYFPFYSPALGSSSESIFHYPTIMLFIMSK